MRQHDRGEGTGEGAIHFAHRCCEDGRAEIDARAAEWLKVSNVPSLAVTYIENGKVA